MKGMYQDVEITTTLTFSCARCWGKLRAKEHKKGEIVVEFCQDCRTDAEAEGYERGLAEGYERGLAEGKAAQE